MPARLPALASADFSESSNFFQLIERDPHGEEEIVEYTGFKGSC